MILKALLLCCLHRKDETSKEEKFPSLEQQGMKNSKAKQLIICTTVLTEISLLGPIQTKRKRERK